MATQESELGDPTLAKEKSWGGEVYIRAEMGPIELVASVFATKFDDHIFQATTGEEAEALPVFQYMQAEATDLGFEASASAELVRTASFTFVGDVVTDYVRAKVKSGGPVPRIPPFRLLGGLEAQSPKLDARIEADHVSDQERVADFERRPMASRF